MYDDLNKTSDESFKQWVKQEQEKARIAQLQKEQAVSFALGTMASIFAGQKRYIAAYKTFAIAQSIMDTYSAANKALTGTPPPFNFIAMGATIAAGLVNVAKISNQKLATGTAFATGGRTLVGETGAEYVDMPRGAKVYSNTQSRTINNDTAVSVTIQDASGSITETFRTQIRSGAADQLIKDINNKIKRLV